MTLLIFSWTAATPAQEQETSGEATTAPQTTATTQSNSGQQAGQPDMTTQIQGEEQNQGLVATLPPASSAISIKSGEKGSGVSYLLPSFQWTGGGFSAQGSSTSSNQTFNSIYVGSLVLQRVHQRSEVNLDYAGGGSFESNSTLHINQTSPSSFGMLQRLGASYIESVRKLRLIFNDQFFYLPESAFGFSGFAGLNSFGEGSGASSLANQVSVNPSLSPVQTLLTGSGGRYSNSLVGEAQYQIGRRSTITASSSYGFLNFVDPGFIDSHYWSFQGGYNYNFTSKNELAFIYVQSLYLFPIHNRGILSRGLELAYQRQITGKLSMKVSGGEVLNEVAQPQGGTIGKLFWISNDSLDYRTRSVDLSIHFTRFVNPGSGVLPGAESNLTTLRLSRKFLRNVFASVQAGYSFNQAIVQASSAERRSRAAVWEAGVTMSHELNKRASVYAHYEFQSQTSNRSLCLGINCGRTFLRDSVGFGINWHGRPIRVH